LTPLLECENTAAHSFSGFVNFRFVSGLFQKPKRVRQVVFKLQQLLFQQVPILGGFDGGRSNARSRVV
jgi:hypothetical protein